MALSLVTATGSVFIACLFILVLILIARYMRKIKENKRIQLPETTQDSVEIAVYAYDSDVSGLDDIKAKHIGIYRDTGLITGIEDDCRVYRESFMPTKDNDQELSLIVRSAVEVKRITDKTILYFFKRMKPLNIKSCSIRVLYDCISQGLSDNRPVVLRMTRFAPGDNNE